MSERRMSQDNAPVWKKPEINKIFWDGEIFLVAVLVTNNITKKSNYEYYKIRASCDSETPVIFVYDDSDESWDVWCWDDVTWYISVNHNAVAGEE
jgi:hypothetical protein